MQLTTERDTAGDKSQRAGKYLTFALGNEEFGIPVLRAREIMGRQDITTVPQTAAYIKGVINLRGKIIPVVDLRLKFGLPETEYTQKTCIVVVQVTREGASMLMGIIVDAVSEVVSLSASDIEDTPEFGDGRTMPFLLGLAKTRTQVKMLLNIDEVLSGEEVLGLQSAMRHRGE